MRTTPDVVRQARFLSRGLAVGILTLLALPRGGWAATPASGTLTPSSGPLGYSAGPFVLSNVSGQAVFPPLCGPGAANPCDDFALTVAIPPGDTTPYDVVIRITWTNPAAEFDVFTFDSAMNVVSYENAPPIPQVEAFQASPGTNTYTVRVIPSTATGDFYNAGISLVPRPAPRPQAGGVAPRYFSYRPPGGSGAGEPSLGFDWKSGNAMYEAFPATFRTSFDDCSSPAVDTWLEKDGPDTSQVTSDAILFTDSTTGRTFVTQLTGPCSLTAFTDDDGDHYTPSQGCGVPAGIDHETVGGGPFAASFPVPPPPAYPHAVYYCSQDAATAFCALSVDGGLTFGAGVPVWNQTQCVGIHGHIKVAPDGTAYVPNWDCNGTQGLAVSNDSGTTWTVRQVQGTGADGLPFASMPAQGLVDPSVGIANDGTVYFGYQNGDGTAHIAVSHDQGVTWVDDQDVGAVLGIRNVTFPEVVAGDPDRAAFAFLGTTTGGNYQDNIHFQGVWYLYIATTYDGGKTWRTVSPLPGIPVQRGSICNSGTLVCVHTPDDRNLLDFMDLTIDKLGRVLAAVPWGCVSDRCISGGPNDFTNATTIVRQAGGKPLFAANDPNPPEPAVPAPPRLREASQAAGGNLVEWSVPDNGGSPITGFAIYRGSTSGGEHLLTTVGPGTDPYHASFLDQSPPAGSNFYQVSAVNAMGEGGRCREVVVTGGGPTESLCTPPGITVLTGTSGDATDRQAIHELLRLQVAQPFVANGDSRIVFHFTVQSLSTLTPKTFYYTSFKGPDNVIYGVRMDVGQSGTPSFEIYHAAANATGGVDGRFVVAGSIKAADPASNYTPDGTITILVKPSDIGLTALGQSLVGFNAAVAQDATVAGAGGTAILDSMPDDLSRVGELKLPGNRSCAPPGPPPVGFFTATPCRVLDTRQGGQGGALSSGSTRAITIAGTCGIPAQATAVAANITVTQPSGAGKLTIYPDQGLPPQAETIWFGAGQTRANNAILALDITGSGTVQVLPSVANSGQVHLLVDVYGWFQ